MEYEVLKMTTSLIIWLIVVTYQIIPTIIVGYVAKGREVTVWKYVVTSFICSPIFALAVLTVRHGLPHNHGKKCCKKEESFDE